MSGKARRLVVTVIGFFAFPVLLPFNFVVIKKRWEINSENPLHTVELIEAVCFFIFKSLAYGTIVPSIATKFVVQWWQVASNNIEPQ